MGKRKRRKANSTRRKARRKAAAAATAEPELEATDAVETDAAPSTEPLPASEEPGSAAPEDAPREATPVLSSTPPDPPGVVAAPVPPVVRIPPSMRVGFIAAIGAAVVSTAAALYVVLRSPAPADPVGSAPTTMAAAVPTSSERPATAEPDASTPELELETTEPVGTPAPPPIGWPDLSVEGLPPVDAAPKSMGQSIGSPRDGALLHGTQLPSGRGYLIRNQDTAWATDNTIEHLTAAIAKVRKRNPQAHRLVIGDISTRRGGPLSGHTSHQAGRDVDIGLYYRGRPGDGPTTFIEATREILDRRATFDLIAALAETRNHPTGVELIVLDYNLQRILRRAAELRGIPDEKLEALFQFPHGPTSLHGLIRHKPAHKDHLHVRFRCPEDDGYCRNPLIGFGGMEAPDPAGT